VNYSFNPISQSTQQQQQQQQQQPSQLKVNPYAKTSPSNAPTVTPATTKKGTTTHSTSQAIPTPSNNPSTPPDKGSESLSFSELKTRLIETSQNAQSYNENYGKTFIVPCKLKAGAGEAKVFNIVKVKKGKKGGGKVSTISRSRL
jgi:hypothetical protein